MWLLTLVTLPKDNAASRMKAWRALKAAGAVALRDGAHLLPATDACREALMRIANELEAGGGSAITLLTREPEGAPFAPLFSRAKEYAELRREIAAAHDTLPSGTAREAVKQSRRLRRNLAGIEAVDFFPGEARDRARAALATFEAAAHRAVSPDEPGPTGRPVTALSLSNYQGRTWATRRRPWVDRLASAWLIRRFIDKQARILWLDHPENLPRDAVGFDFDGAEFTHTGDLVTFGTLLVSFGLTDDAALLRLGTLIHFLDVGGVRPPEAEGIEIALKGLSGSIPDDDLLLESASRLFDGLHAGFEQESA